MKAIKIFTLASLITALIILLNIQVEAAELPEEVKLLAEVMYYENYNNGPDAMIITGNVVMNRVMSKRYPNTVKEVLYQVCGGNVQYSTTGKFFKRQIPVECYFYAILVYVIKSFVPRNVVYQSMFMQGSGLYKKINTDYFCYQ